MRIIHIRCDCQVATILVDYFMKTGYPDSKVIMALRSMLRGSNSKVHFTLVNDNVETRNMAKSIGLM